ncbi:MAG: hypothetical protein JWQ02_3124, partial [Capsulimonas sp.]|nr:hypothetical protein [Capsulimonas sp.]
RNHPAFRHEGETFMSRASNSTQDALRAVLRWGHVHICVLGQITVTCGAMRLCFATVTDYLTLTQKMLGR